MAVKGLIDFIFEQGSKPENLMRLGLLTPESVANPTALKTAKTKYKKSLQNPAVAAREEGRLTNPPVINQGLLSERNIIRPEDIENTILVSHKGDTSSTDTKLLELGGVKFDNPPESRGGVRFGDSPKTPEELYWASMAAGAVPLQNKAEGLMAAFDMPVTGVYGAMGDEALFFNDAFSDTMLQSAQKLPIPKKSIEVFDADMRKIKDDWVGINHPDARDQLLGLNGYPREGAGGFRSAFASRMSMAKYRDLGFPAIEDVKSAFREPGLENTSLGDSGYIMGRIGQGYGLTKNTNHLSYDTGIMGDVLGGFEQSLPNRIAYPDAYRMLESEMTKPKDPSKSASRLFTESEKVDAIAKRKDLFQVADAKWVDTASKWLEDNKGASNAALIAAVGLPATMATQEAEAGAAGLLNKIRAYHGSPHDFDRFSTESIGTGEGAQQYGHGLYFAEREPTALSYRDALTPRDYEFENYLAMQNEMAENSGDYTRMEFLQQAMNHDTPQDFRNIASDSDYDDDYREMAADFADEMEAFRNESGEPVNFGRMYEVDIDARPEELLDFDAPLSEQSDQVKNMWDNWKASAAGKKVAAEMPGNFEGDITGQEMHGLIYEGMSPSPEQQYGRGMAIKESIDATQYLRDQGLKGIKYADAQTRFSPKGRTSNYVIFDDATVDIARKYGVSMPVAAGLLSSGLGTEQAQAAEYREAPVVQEQSFGDMVNEYANINQRAQAAEAQKFGLLMREDARLRDMGSASFGQVSPELAAYRRSQILPTIGEMGMGALEGAVDTVDFVSQLPTAISTMTMPKRTPLRDRLGGLLDYSFVDERDQRARDQARLIGGLLSPI
jgi:hypothetical protein